MPSKKELTPRQEALLEALIGPAKGDIREAMDLAGYSPTTSIREAVKPIREEITEAASMIVAMHSPQAAGAMVGILKDPAALGARNIIAAAKELLDRAGVVKTEKVEVASTGGGMFILPPKKTDD